MNDEPIFGELHISTLKGLPVNDVIPHLEECANAPSHEWAAFLMMRKFIPGHGEPLFIVVFGINDDGDRGRLGGIVIEDAQANTVENFVFDRDFLYDLCPHTGYIEESQYVMGHDERIKPSIFLPLALSQLEIGEAAFERSHGKSSS